MHTPLNVLIVEDSPEDTAVLQRHLRRAGYDARCERVETAEDMSAALENWRWDAVLSDNDMPRFSASMALQVLKQKGLDTPLIVVSGVLLEEKAAELMQSGARDFIPKGKMARLGPALRRELADAAVRAERRCMEQARRETEEQWRRLLDSTAGGIFGLDLAGRITFLNAAGAKLLGYDDTEPLAGAPFSEINCRAGESLFRVLHQGETIHMETECLRRADGTRLPVEYWAHPVLREGIVTGAVVTFHDVSACKKSEEALRNTEERFRQLAENIDEVFWMMNADETEMLYISPAYESIWGQSCETLYRSPMSWLDSIHPDDRGKAHDVFLRQMAGERIDSEYRICRPDGSERWIRDRAFPIRSESGQLSRLAGIAEDVTERKRIESALRRSESKFHGLAESNIIGVMVGDFTGRILEANDSSLGILSYTRDDLEAGRVRWDTFTPPEHMPGTEEMARQLRTSGVSRPWDTEALRKDGRRVPVLIGGAMLEGSLDQVITFMLDLTDLKRAEAAQAQLAALVRSSEDAIIGKTLDGVIVSWNDAAERLYGYSVQEAVGMPISRLVPAGRRGELGEVTETVQRGESVCFETVRVRKDGSAVDVSLTVSPIRDASGGITGASTIARDITARKQADAALRSAMKAGELASRAKSEFMANISHELRTPLNGVIGMTDLALSTQLTEEQRDYLDLARSSADSLLNVISDILELTNIHAGRLHLNSMEFSLRSSIRDVVQPFLASARAKSLDLSWEISPDVPDRLLGDPERLGQVIGHLLGNAIKFTRRGAVALRVAPLSQDTENVELRFTVRDTGIGIPPDKQKLIFEPFSQADGSSTRKFGGAGLGLTVSVGLIERMGGRIWVESEEGQGSRFHFTVRLRAA